jgi:hypothetical protein
VMFKVLSRWRKNKSCHMWNSCCVNKLKLWHLSFHHSEALPKKIFTSMGLKCVIWWEKQFVMNHEKISCCVWNLKLWHLGFRHNEGKKYHVMCEIHVWQKLKLWHLKFHHNEAPKKIFICNGCKMCHIGN